MKGRKEKKEREVIQGKRRGRGGEERKKRRDKRGWKE